MTGPFFLFCALLEMITTVVKDAIRRRYASACAAQSHSFYSNDFKLKQGEATCPVLKSTPNLRIRSVSLDLLKSES